MREVSDIINNSILELQSFVYCFEIKLLEDRKLYLTSCDHPIKHNSIIYLPNSGLSIKEGAFNDSAQDYIILQGIFEEKGIEKSLDVTGALFEILTYSSEYLYHFVTYTCTTYTKHDLEFIIYLQPETIKYNQNLLNVYSKTCRTNFGDSRCKVNKNAYSKIYEIVEISIRNITVNNIDKDSGYYIGGDVILDSDKFIAKILNSYLNTVVIDRAIPEYLKNSRQVILVAGCDKKFITCCNKFNNAVNFRGEPLIPEYNFLSII